ncbi:MAG: site-specific integrase [Lachnospiraceae bacterium]|nr:site-specific integrase [Lachnospiraceae bacterium]
MRRTSPFDCISRESVEDYLEWFENDKDYSVSSRNQRLAAIKSFLEYSSERDKTLMALNL